MKWARRPKNPRRGEISLIGRELPMETNESRSDFFWQFTNVNKFEWDRQKLSRNLIRTGVIVLLVLCSQLSKLRD
jgi:hypothetical protein